MKIDIYFPFKMFTIGIENESHCPRKTKQGKPQIFILGKNFIQLGQTMLNIMCGNELSYKAMFRNAELLANSAVCYNHEFANFKMAVKFYFTKFL